MSVFALKMLALIAMACDHIGLVFGWDGWALLPFDASILRYIGRIAFPIFAFCLAEGWRHTRNREAYLSRLALFAALSQIPFTLAFYPPNLMAPDPGTAVWLFRLRFPVLAVGLLGVAAWWYFGGKKRITASLWAVVAAAVLPGILLKGGQMWLLADAFNVLYTMLLGAAELFLLDELRTKSLKLWEGLALAAVLALLIAAYGVPADYGHYCMGLMLIVGLYLTHGSRFRQAAVIAAWSVVLYGLIFHGWHNAVAALAAVPILLYRETRRPQRAGGKWLFYGFYALHLLVLGICNIAMRL